VQANKNRPNASDKKKNGQITDENIANIMILCRQIRIYQMQVNKKINKEQMVCIDQMQVMKRKNKKLNKANKNRSNASE